MSQGSYFVGLLSDFSVILSLKGTLRYQESTSLEGFIEETVEKGTFSEFTVDLNDVAYIDSTHLGLIARIAVYFLEKKGKKILVYSPSPQIFHLMSSSGFEQICDLKKESYLSTLSQWSELKDSHRPLAALMYRAHDILSKMNKKNRELYAPVVALLKEAADREIQ